MRTNKEWFKSLHAERARFFLCDLHVHSPASRDVIEGERFDVLSQPEKDRMAQAKDLPKSWAEYENELVEKNLFPVEAYLEQLVSRRDRVFNSFQACEGDNLGIVAITDHNVCLYACRLAAYAWEKRNVFRLIVLPGIELEVIFPIPNTTTKTSAHVLLIFTPTTDDRSIYSAVRDAAGGNWTYGQALEVSSLPQFINCVRRHNDFPALAVAAHVDTGKGLQARAVKAMGECFRAPEAEFARLTGELELIRSKQPQSPASWEMTEVVQSIEGVKKEIGTEDEISLQVLELIGHCGFDGLQVQMESTGRHYRRLHRFERETGRAVPLVASDAHRIDDVFVCKNGEVPFIKLSALLVERSPKEIFDEIRGRGIRFGETRLAVRSPGEVTCWISGIEISPDGSNAKTFWPFSGNDSQSFTVPLARNLNCLIGGRGSGKSAAIEAISFAAHPKYLEDRDHGSLTDDFRKRATATLSGCNVRLCWTRLDGEGNLLPKRAIFATRYYNGSGRHQPIAYSDLNNKELPAADLPVDVFRLREIEDLVDRPERLRDLFDNLCGQDIAVRTGKISTLVEHLKGQRRRLSDIAREICKLTSEGMPLRFYVYRKLAYDAVNSEGVRAKYERLDGAATAADVAKTTESNWKTLCDEFDLPGKKKQVEDFFTEVGEAVTDDENNLLPFSSPLAPLVQTSQEAGAIGKSLKDRVIDAVNQLDSELSAVTQVTGESGGLTLDIVKAEREKLAAEGLPLGGKEREAKKEEFDEAVQALEQYKKLVALWDQEMEVRNATFKELEAECKARTEDRQTKATEITARLRQELDPSILVIEIDARPMADKRGLEDWINGHLYPPNTRSKDARTAALIEDGLMPKKLQDVLLGKEQFPVVVRGNVAKGQIDKETAAQFVGHCWGMRQLPPEKQQSDLTPEQWESLPEEIRNGLMSFPIVPDSDGKLDEKRLNVVLGIDEIVFDDLPEIRLMDRPGEMKAARPLGELSHGQRCSAILPILLLNGTCPLVIDQPEDNLDNRLIREVVVKILAAIKLKRQVILATHNPNLPVLGDVEQTIVLRAIEDNKCQLQVTGNLDESAVVRRITEVMEGGREAFQYRHSIYQPYWEGPVDVEERVSES